MPARKWLSRLRAGFSATHGKANKGLGCLRGIVSRFNFTNGGYERSPQSLTCHTAGTLVVMLALN